MRFIRDIINDKRAHASPESVAETASESAAERAAQRATDKAAENSADRAAAESSGCFAATPDLGAAHDDHALEPEPQHERRQSLDQGQIDESALRNIFMDAEPGAAEPLEPVDTAYHPDIETAPIETTPDTIAPDGPRGSDRRAALDAALEDTDVETDVQDDDWDTGNQSFGHRETAASPAPKPQIQRPQTLVAEPPSPHRDATPVDPMSGRAQGDRDTAAAPVEMPQPAAGRSVGRSGRVKTRVLGFGQPQDPKLDVFSAKAAQAPQTPSTHPVGWLVVVEGPGQGSAFSLYDGVASIGRGEDQTVSLAFGDNSISRENHAAIAYDEEQRSFFLGHGGKTNLVRMNGRPVLSTEELKSDDMIRIGETTLRFVALCGATFSWSQVQQSGAGHVAAR